MSGAKEEPLFDSSRAALEFAFNAVKVIMPAPFMNKAMAEIKVKYRRTKKARKGFNKEALELLDAQDEHDMTSKGSAALLRPLRGLEAAAQAGIILKHVERLETPHKTILAGLTIRPSNPCSCCSPCCKGDRTDARWSQAVSTMCDLVREAGDITKTAGKRGLSSHPAMR